MKNINSYIHIPFCNKKCKYCRFASFSWLNQLAINNYVNFLCKEIISTNWKYCLDTIYFWWWTPTTLSLNQFEKIFLNLREKFTFSENIEISIDGHDSKSRVVGKAMSKQTECMNTKPKSKNSEGNSKIWKMRHFKVFWNFRKIFSKK